MKTLFILFLTILSAASITPNRVVVVYNSNSTASKEVADYYIAKRGVPAGNLIGLNFANTLSLSQAQYLSVAAELQEELVRRKLWKLDGAGVVSAQKFDVFLLTYDVPFQLQGTKFPPTVNAQGEPVPARNRRNFERDHASVDSELTLLGRQPYKMEGIVKNPFYQQKQLTGMTMVARIDAPSAEVCKRMIDDAVAVEKTGLYGKCYLDLARKGGGYETGDNWLKGIYDKNLSLGIPTIMDQSKDIFVTNYPLLDAAIYFGWYAGKASGALRNPVVKLKQGSVAVHLHSFSARELRHPVKGWVGPLLNNGATATLGNVFEPYLTYTTNFQLFYDQLSQGKTFVESAWYATPILSWQSVVVGDPLYAPFKNRKPLSPIDKNYDFLRGKAPFNNPKNLEAIAKKADTEKSSLYYETVGLVMSLGSDKGLPFFTKSAQVAKTPNEMLANTLHEISYYRHNGNKPRAVELIKKNILVYEGTPQQKPLLALRNILDPPPPPPVSDETLPPKK